MLFPIFNDFISVGSPGGPGYGGGAGGPGNIYTYLSLE